MASEERPYSRDYSLYAFCTACFRIPGFIWEATWHILAQQQLCGLAARPILMTNRARFQPEINSEDRRAQLVNGIAPSIISAETADDIARFIADRFLACASTNVSLSEVALAKVANAYMHNGVFEQHIYTMLSQPVLPAVALFVLECLHPTMKPEPKLVLYPNEASHKAPDVYLSLWHHSYLRIPISTHEHEQGVCGKYASKNAPLWMHTFSYLFCTHGSSVATAWRMRYPGIQTPLYSISECTPTDVHTVVDKVYDGWVWMLATVHWLLVGIACAPDATIYQRMKLWLRHYITALAIAANPKNKVSTHAFDVSRVTVQPVASWGKNLLTIDRINVSSAVEFLDILQKLGIVVIVPLDLFGPLYNRRPDFNDLVLDYTTAQKSWHRLLLLFDAGVQTYLSNSLNFL